MTGHIRAAETWTDLMARCVGWAPGRHGAVTYVLDDGRCVDTFLGGGSLADPVRQCPQARQMTEDEAHQLWATRYVPGPEYQAAQEYFATVPKGRQFPPGALP